MSEEMELEGEWVMGWPDRKRARVMPSKDSEGRTIFARSPVLDLEGVLTPTDAYYVIAQLNMPDPVHPCLLYTSPSPRDRTRSRMPSSA